MYRKLSLVTGVLLLGMALPVCNGPSRNKGIQSDKDQRMEWWREARFGLFIHWGLYAIPAGEWKDQTNHAEWIRHTARIPLEEYDQLLEKFNPVKFDADEWVRIAEQAGMKYIVITSKHHDGFSLFNSRYTDFDVMSTPFQRDIMKELAQACRKRGMEICWYHSIMDWHHPDYIPRRDWETERTLEDADFNRYVAHMKNQLKELVKNYGRIGVLWFDGQWESTWNHEYGQDLYNYVRSLQPDIIINNRVDVGRGGMAGMTEEGEYAGDFGTPEQEIPATGLPGVDWETCMTMNDHWGYNKNDENWKSVRDLIQKLADIASKGGNFLLNVGPTSEGIFPQASIDRLQAMGKWLEINGEAIYGTQASPFRKLSWGRCTQKPGRNSTKLYLHVFEWPVHGELVVPGLYSLCKNAYLLADPERKSLNVVQDEDALIISIPAEAPDPNNSVVVLDIDGQPDISNPPDISAAYPIFVDALDVQISSDRQNVEIRFTTDGTIPHEQSHAYSNPLHITETTVVSARCFRDGKPVSGSVQSVFTKVRTMKSMEPGRVAGGLEYAYFEGDWDRLPDFSTLKPVKNGIINNFNLGPRNRKENFGFAYSGLIHIPEDGIYTFYTDSDDGSRLFLDNRMVVDNDGLHGMQEASGTVALAKGYHSLRVIYFNKTGGDGLRILYESRGITKARVPGAVLYHTS